MFGSNYNDHRASLGYSIKSLKEVDWAFHARAQWAVEFAWWPHCCEITRRIIWLQHAYRGCVRWHDGWGPAEYRWHDRHEHLIWVLKGPYG